MRHRVSEHSAGGRRTTRLAASATAAAGTLALVVPIGLHMSPTMVKRNGPSHRISLHAGKASAHGHHAHPSVVADLTAFSAHAEIPLRPLSAVSTTHPRERLAPTALARGPPNRAGST